MDVTWYHIPLSASNLWTKMGELLWKFCHFLGHLGHKISPSVEDQSRKCPGNGYPAPGNQFWWFLFHKESVVSVPWRVSWTNPRLVVKTHPFPAETRTFCQQKKKRQLWASKSATDTGMTARKSSLNLTQCLFRHIDSTRWILHLKIICVWMSRNRWVHILWLSFGRLMKLYSLMFYISLGFSVGEWWKSIQMVEQVLQLNSSVTFSISDTVITIITIIISYWHVFFISFRDSSWCAFDLPFLRWVPTFLLAVSLLFV